MSHHYVIAEPTGAALMPLKELVELAEQRWPGARDEGDGYLGLRAVPELHARALMVGDSSLGLVNGELEDCYEVARWVRSVVSDDQELVVADSASGGILYGFTLATTLEELRAAFAS